MTNPNRRESRASRLFDWSERHEGWTLLIIIALVFSVVLGGGAAFTTYAAYSASEHAKTYVGRHTYTGAKWFMFQGTVELYEDGQGEGQGLRVPVNTEFGSRVADEFIKSWREGEDYRPDLKVPFTAEVTYTEEPQNKWRKDTVTKSHIEGAYLRFEVIDQTDRKE